VRRHATLSTCRTGIAVLALSSLSACMPALALLAPLPSGMPASLPDGMSTAVAPVIVPPIIDVAADGRLDLTINGTAVTAYASPGMPSAVTVSQQFARTLFGEPAMTFAPSQAPGLFGLSLDPRRRQSRIGSVRIDGRAEQVALGFPFGAVPAWAVWHAADTYDRADLLLGPHALPSAVVRFQLRPEQPGEQSFILPLDDANRWWLATTTLVVDGHELRFALAPQFATSVASAAAGAALARTYGGGFAGDVRPVLIAHGVARPVRQLAFDRALRIGGLALPAVLVRTRDYGSTEGIGEQANDDPSEDAGDIVVTGRRQRSAPLYVVYVGADALSGCSSITYDKDAKLIRLACLPD
jgi:hypothetical protein